MKTKHTPGPWRTEYVSDAVRVVVGSGRLKVILARLAPKQLPEAETSGNAELMAAAPDLLEACRKGLALIEAEAPEGHYTEHPDIETIRAAITKATGGRE